MNIWTENIRNSEFGCSNVQLFGCYYLFLQINHSRLFASLALLYPSSRLKKYHERKSFEHSNRWTYERRTFEILSSDVRMSNCSAATNYFLRKTIRAFSHRWHYFTLHHDWRNTKKESLLNIRTWEHKNGEHSKFWVRMFECPTVRLLLITS
jgi:hypothetical protein